MNIAYVLLGCFFLYLTYAFIGVVFGAVVWVAECISWLFTDAVSWSFVIFMGKFFLWFGGVGFFIYILLRTTILDKFFGTFGKGISYIAPPFYIAAVPFRWIGDGWIGLCEFVSMFYEENCPPIKLVSKEEAVVESIAQNGEEV